MSRLGGSSMQDGRRICKLARLLLALGATYLNNVNLPALAETAAALQSAAERAQRPFFSAWARFGQGCLHYQRNELVDAIESFRSVDQLREWCHSRAILESLGGLALALHAVGRQGEAETVVAELREYVAENDLVNLRMLPEALALRISSEQDRHAVGKMQLEALSAQPATDIALGLIEAPALVAVRIYLDKGDADSLEAAAALLQPCREAAVTLYLISSQIEIGALKARLLAAQGEVADALAALRTSILLAAPGGALRLIADVGPALYPLLRTLREEEGMPADYLDALLAAHRPERRRVEKPGRAVYRDKRRDNRSRESVEQRGEATSAPGASRRPAHRDGTYVS